MATFWKEQASQPKRNYRFKITMTGFAAGESIIWWAKTFKPPSYEMSEATHDYLDNKFYWPGRITWADVTMQLVDPVSPNAVQQINAVLKAGGYAVKDNAAVKPFTTSKDKLVTGTGDVIAEIVNADGTVIERWTLKNAWLKAASWSDLDYTNDELRTIDITFRYDWAQCQNMVNGEMATEQFTSALAPPTPIPMNAADAATDDTTAT